MFNGQKITNISGIATLFPEVVQIIVRKETGITSLNDFSGRKIAVGSKDSGTYYNAQQILSMAGVWEKLDHQYINAGEAMKELQEGRIDGFIFTSGLPNPAIIELAKKVEITLLPVDPELVQKLVTPYSFYYPSTIEASQYPGQTQEISAIEINAIIVSGPALSDNDQYLLTSHLFGQPNDLGQSHPRLSKMTKNSLRRQMPVQLGKGAYKAYSEMP
jgi:TRAP transporter TAXI family solute receptor